MLSPAFVHRMPRTGFLLREATVALRGRAQRTGLGLAWDLLLILLLLEIPSRLKPQLRLQESASNWG